MLKKEYRSGSGGQGEFRGGLGQRIEFAHIKGESFYVSKMFDRIKNPPRGRHGGGAGRSAKVYLKGDKVLNGMGRELIPAENLRARDSRWWWVRQSKESRSQIERKR